MLKYSKDQEIYLEKTQGLNNIPLKFPDQALTIMKQQFLNMVVKINQVMDLGLKFK